jgi:hypothetical protein
MKKALGAFHTYGGLTTPECEPIGRFLRPIVQLAPPLVDHSFVHRAPDHLPVPTTLRSRWQVSDKPAFIDDPLPSDRRIRPAAAHTDEQAPARRDEPSEP